MGLERRDLPAIIAGDDVNDRGKDIRGKEQSYDDVFPSHMTLIIPDGKINSRVNRGLPPAG
jgi:hypothetical protein